MKTYCTFSDFRRMHMEDDELFECLASMCPECLVLRGKSLKIKLEDTDPRLPKIIKMLDLAGWPQKERPVRLPPYGPKGYLLTTSYVYEESDYDQFDFFGIGPKSILPFFNKARTSDDGTETICIPIDGLAAFRGYDFLVLDSPCRGGLIVTERVKAALESEDLVGLGFAEVRLIDKAGDDVPWHEYEPEQWWELESPLELPPPCENVILSNPATSERLPQDTREPALLSMVDPLGPSYTRSSLVSIEPFDMARSRTKPTREKRGAGHLYSKRFCDLLRANGFEFTWRPVRIDENA